MYRESQELIEWRERQVSRELCRQIRAYEKLRQKWFIGPIRCRCFRTRLCGIVYMRVYGHFWDLNGVKKSVFLQNGLIAAMIRCDSIKTGLWYQTNEHVQLPFPEYGPQNQIGLDETHG